MAENRLLIIEDDKAIAKALTMNLELAGYIVTHYDDGGQALDGLKQDHSFDLALLDMMLPGVDGFGLLPVLGSDGIPVICLTALTDTQSEIQGLREGAENAAGSSIGSTASRTWSWTERTGSCGGEGRPSSCRLWNSMCSWC